MYRPDGGAFRRFTSVNTTDAPTLPFLRAGLNTPILVAGQRLPDQRSLAGGGPGVPLTSVDREQEDPVVRGESGPSAHRDPVIAFTDLAELAD